MLSAIGRVKECAARSACPDIVHQNGDRTEHDAICDRDFFPGSSAIKGSLHYAGIRDTPARTGKSAPDKVHGRRRLAGYYYLAFSGRSGLKFAADRIP